ncbi:uncharacterized protein LOC110697054 [Chenopodium quinoa]|uniref:uncharacterized protein LOC110697054 n=1 Tax=Chenopodium quinoa TaxID=63459 RepID=UPI000B772F78|nr:uncharacterized protein LOC110697054 [Chenopodium quinoa]
MASLFNSLVTFALFSSLLVQGTLGGITCEQLNKEECAFAVSSIGKRCVLEKYVRRSGLEAFKCTTSAIEADKLKDLVETSHCIQACGLDRDTLGISSDSLLESRFTQKLCSPQCYQRCPNVIDLYFNLAAGEGVYLPKLCETQSENPRRGMSEMKSSGIATPGPISATNLLGAPIISVELGAAADAPIGSPTSYIELSDEPVDAPAPTPALPPYY